jgi:phenylpropionate dioxygenase-like ring-hydroxylating dioxygenase large terminal subunit
VVDDPVLIDGWFPVARAESITLGTVTAVRLLGEDLVIWRGEDGVHAWKDLCVHRGTRLSLGTAGRDTLSCPYHGWTYDESGHCVHIPAHPKQIPPAKASVVTYQAQERYGLVWISLGDPSQDVPEFPEDGQPGYDYVLSGPFGPIQASAPRIIENFLDVAHFPFVHRGVLGDESRPEIEPYEVELDPSGITARKVVVYQPDPYGTGVGDEVSYSYRVPRPFTAYLAKETRKGTRLSILFPITPHDERISSAWFYMAMSDTEGLDKGQIDRFHSSILAQDVPIVESQRPELLPLDLQAELHLQSDRAAIAYRKWLNELGLSFGTS